MRIPLRPAVPALLLTCLMALSAAPAAASEPGSEGAGNVPRAWTREFESPVLWQRVTPLGDLLVKTAAALHGVDPVTGEIRWSHVDLGDLSQDRYELIEGTPFVVIGDERKVDRVVILDSMTGQLAFDSWKAGIGQIDSRHLLPRSNGLLIFGVPEGKTETQMSLYEIASGERRWASKATEGKKRMAVKLASLFLEKAGEEEIRISNEAVEIDESSFLMASDLGIFRVDSRTGEIAWKVSGFPAGHPRIFLSPVRPGIFVLGGETRDDMGSSGQRAWAHYGAYRLSDGSPLWEKPIRLDGEVNPVVFHEAGVILSPRTEGKGYIRLIDYETGNSLWGRKGKGIKALGGIVDHVTYGSRILLTTGYDNPWTSKRTEFYLNVLDVPSGTFAFEESRKVSGRILAAEMLPAGILYVTDSEIGFLDPATGEPRSATGVECEGCLISARGPDGLYAFSTEQKALFRVDKAAATITRISDKPVRFEDKEIPYAMEIGDDGITVLSNQNIAAFGLDGALRFHRYHPAPSHSGLMKAILWANAVRAGMYSAATGMYGAASASAASRSEAGSLGRELGSELAEELGEASQELAGISGRYARAARARFSASANAPDFAFMMVRVDGKGYGLAQVSKSTGEILSVIDMKKEKQPSYEVDGIASRVFHRVSDRVIAAYQM